MAFPNNRTLVGVIMSMIAWAVWFVVVYGLTGVGCDAGWHLQDTALGNRLSVAMVAVTLLTVAFQAWCAWRGWVGYRAGREGTAGPGLEAAKRARFLGLVMLVVALIAIVSTLMIGLPILMLDPCAA